MQKPAIVFTISILITTNSKFLYHKSSFRYYVKLARNNIGSLINSKNKINAMNLTFVITPGLIPKPTNIGT